MSEKKELTKFQVFLKEYVPYIVFLIAVVLFKTFCYSPVYVSGESMMNTLHDGDIMILDIIGSKQHDYQRFDWNPIRLDFLFLGLFIVLFYLFRLLYDVRKQTQRRPIYIEEESNLEAIEDNNEAE